MPRPTRPTTPEEYRLAQMRVQRRAMRAVKRTLIAIALFAVVYYMILIKTQSGEQNAEEPADNRSVVQEASPVVIPNPDVASVPQNDAPRAKDEL